MIPITENSDLHIQIGGLYILPYIDLEKTKRCSEISTTKTMTEKMYDMVKGGWICRKREIESKRK